MPRGSGWKLPGLILGGFGALGLAAWIVHLCLDAQLEKHREECLAIQQACPADPTPRPAILGPEEPGNIWDCYRPAFAGLRGLDPEPEEELSENIGNRFHVYGSPGKAPPLLEAAEPFLELCRSAVRRRAGRWWGSKDPALPAAAARAVKALCSKGRLEWQAGRDAAAAQWVLAALTVSSDVARLSGSWEFLGLTEGWVLEELQAILSLQNMTVPQLEDLSRKLDLLRSARLSFVTRLRDTSSRSRLEILDGDPEFEGEGFPVRFPLSSKIDWRDLNSLRVAKIRLLGALRSCGRELETVPWNGERLPSTEMNRVISGYKGRYIQQLMPYGDVFARQDQDLLRLDLLSVAVHCARFQAVHGRLPKSGSEAGLTQSFVPHLEFFEDRIFLNTTAMGMYFVNSDLPQRWAIQRRPPK